MLCSKVMGGKTAFHIICHYGHIELAELFLQKSNEFKIDLNAKDDYCERTAFHEACANGHLELAEMLVDKSVEFSIDLNKKDEYGRTAFHLAICNSHHKTGKSKF